MEGGGRGGGGDWGAGSGGGRRPLLVFDVWKGGAIMGGVMGGREGSSSGRGEGGFTAADDALDLWRKGMRPSLVTLFMS